MKELLILLLFSLCACAADAPVEKAALVPPADGPIVIDVRTSGEYNAGHIDGALHIPYEIIGDKIAALTEDKNRPLVLYCHSGRRSGIAQKTLQNMGYTQVENAGGIEAYRKKLGQ